MGFNDYIMNFFQGESKQIILQYRDSGMKALDMTGYVFSLVGKESELQPDPLFTKDDSCFDKTDAASGKITLTFLADMPPMAYMCQITAAKGKVVDKSTIFQVEVSISL